MVIYCDLRVNKKMENSSHKITAIRVQNDLTQAQFAKSLGYSKGYIANIETGRTKPSRRFLEALSREYKLSIEYLFQDTLILDLIESNKQNENPDLIFLYAFTQKGIDNAEKELRLLLEGRKYILVDATGIKSVPRFYKKILNREGRASDLINAIKDMMLNQEIILIIKNMSLSKIPSSGSYLKEIYKFMDDAWDSRQEGEKVITFHRLPKSSLVVLDFASYLEKNMQSGFGYYAVPIHVGDVRYRNK